MHFFNHEIHLTLINESYTYNVFRLQFRLIMITHQQDVVWCVNINLHTR